jgi:Fur family transcriptional regulator, ferric uptake regulator
MPGSQDSEEALFERLLGTGVRPTKQRLLVLETLAAEPHDATAQEIHARLRERGEKVGLATVYRALAVLREREVVELEGCEIDTWVTEASKTHGFRPASHTVEVVGLCADCLAA